MNFEQFKTEWKDSMVYNPKKFDFENTMHEFYIEYKKSLETYLPNGTVNEWCEFFFPDNDLDTHPFMIKRKAFKTKHVNGLIKAANEFAKNWGYKQYPLNPES